MAKETNQPVAEPLIKPDKKFEAFFERWAASRAPGLDREALRPVAGDFWKAGYRDAASQACEVTNRLSFELYAIGDALHSH